MYIKYNETLLIKYIVNFNEYVKDIFDKINDDMSVFTSYLFKNVKDPKL